MSAPAPRPPGPPPPRPPHREPRLVALVAAGGAVGTLLRYGVGVALPATTVVAGTAVRPPALAPDLPLPTLAVNLAGALLLGLLTGTLARQGPDEGRRRAVRLAVGTGVLGGYTTYSTLALDVVRLAATGRPGAAAGYAALTLVVGLGAAALGLALGTAAGRPAHGTTGGTR